MPDEPTTDPSIAKPEIFISRNNQTHGPYPREVVVSWVNTGKVNRFDLACTDQTPWQPVEKLLYPERFVASAPAPTPISSTGMTGKQLALIIGGATIFVLLILIAAIVDIAQKQSAPTPTKTTSSQTASTGNPAQDILLNLSPSNQATFLGKSVGEGCVGTYAYFMGMAPDTRNVFWSVRCTNAKSYEVMISPDATGTTKVLECNVLQLVTKSRCFEKLRE
jgi:hypothetical protein